MLASGAYGRAADAACVCREIFCDNVEDIRIDHDTSRPTGLVELVVDERSGEMLLVSLESRGWVTHR